MKCGFCQVDLINCVNRLLRLVDQNVNQSSGNRIVLIVLALQNEFNKDAIEFTLKFQTARYFYHNILQFMRPSLPLMINILHASNTIRSTL